MGERGFISRDQPRQHKYWPPPEFDQEAAEPPVILPRGRKQVMVCPAKRDVDGYLEAQVVFATRQGHKLFALNEEELAELEKLAPRISEYLELWQEKAALDPDEAEERTLKPKLED